MMPSGESLGSSNLPFRGAKGTLYEGGVRTPAFIHIPHLNAGNIGLGLLINPNILTSREFFQFHFLCVKRTIFEFVI